MEISTQTALICATQEGDQKAFEALVSPYQRELLVHCYRMLGSFHDAEDLVQETLLRAWEKRTTLASPAAYRPWLYRISTNLCLDRLRSSPQRSLPRHPHPSPQSKRGREPIHLEPFPDDLEASPHSDPQDRAERNERTTLAFLVALQRLTPAQRAILLLREVLEWPASEVAEWLNLSVAAVNSGLQRARRALQEHSSPAEREAAPPIPQIQSLLDRYVTSFEQADIPGFVALLREDAWFTMPSLPAWFKGRSEIAESFSTTAFTPGKRWHLLPTSANGSPAFGVYRQEAWEDRYRLFGLMVLGVVEGQIANMVMFLELSSFSFLALPPAFAYAGEHV
jgi:RNA polymerase sigma-70 factor, ECF subfamily